MYWFFTKFDAIQRWPQQSRNPNAAVHAPSWEEVEARVRQCRTAVEPPPGLMRNSNAGVIGGELQVVIHGLRGLHKPAGQCYFSVEVLEEERPAAVACIVDQISKIQFNSGLLLRMSSGSISYLFY